MSMVGLSVIDDAIDQQRCLMESGDYLCRVATNHCDSLCFTKRLVGMKTLSYAQRIKILNLQTLELRRLHIDLVHCYKIIFGLLDVSCEDFFTLCQSSTTRTWS